MVPGTDKSIKVTSVWRSKKKKNQVEVEIIWKGGGHMWVEANQSKVTSSCGG